MANCFKVFHNNELYAIVGTPFTAKTVDGVKYVPMPYITPRGHREYPCWGCVAHAARGELAAQLIATGCGGMIHGLRVHPRHGRRPVAVRDSQAGVLTCANPSNGTAW
jgi:hypothetical protein